MNLLKDPTKYKNKLIRSNIAQSYYASLSSIQNPSRQTKRKYRKLISNTLDLSNTLKVDYQKLNKGLKHSYSTAISVIPGTGQYTLTTYLWDAATTGTWPLNPGDPGQEITIIPTTGILTLSNGSGTTIQTSTGGNITVAQNANITLRFINTIWHVVATSPTGVTGY